MAHTPEQRSAKPLCGANRKWGGTCRAFAGQGTDHLGVGRCKNHGGNTPSHGIAAERELVRQQAALGAPLDVDPDTALRGLLRASAGHVAYLSATVQGLTDVASPTSQALLRAYDNERDRLAKVASTCLASGISQRDVKLQQDTANTFAAAIDNAIKAVGGFTTEQRKSFGVALRLELAMLAEPAPESIA